ncbi:hypothetical protein Ancab_010573 [Ancistrocladus abbreviatus]
MEIAVRTLSLGFNPQILRLQQKVDGFVQNQLVKTACSSLHQRTSYRCFPPVCAISSAIPKDILLEVLGPSKVYKQVIKKVINKTVAQYVKKEQETGDGKETYFLKVKKVINAS